MFPSSSSWCRSSEYTETCCTFWLNVNIFGTHWAHTFLNNKCSKDNFFNPSNTVGRDMSHCNSSLSWNQLFDALNVHTKYSCWLNTNMWDIRDFFTTFRKLTVPIMTGFLPCSPFDQRTAARFSFTRNVTIQHSSAPCVKSDTILY
jgi:hypothetical protein